MREKIEEKVRVEKDRKLRLVQILESGSAIVPTKVEKGYTPVAQTPSTENNAGETQRPSLMVRLPCPGIAGSSQLSQEGSDDEGPEPLTAEKLAYFKAHFRD